MKRSRYQNENGRPHVVPLAPQAVVALRELQPLTCHGAYVFPSMFGGARPMSENTVNTALCRLGYDRDTDTAHGFRAMARTVMVQRLGVNQKSSRPSLRTESRAALGAAYDRSEFLDQRRKLMVQWADYLDKLRGNARMTSRAKRSGD